MKTSTLLSIVFATIVILGAVLGGLMWRQSRPIVPDSAKQTATVIAGRCPAGTRLYNTVRDDATAILAEAEQVCRLALVRVDTLPFDLARLPNVRELTIRRSNFFSLPPAIGSLSSLAVLDLSNNPQLRQLPDTVGGLPNLQVLKIDGTAITELPPAILMLSNLKTLVIHRGQLPEAQVQLLHQTYPGLNVIEFTSPAQSVETTS